MAKRKSPPQQQQLSPKKYILTRARSLPLYKCLINNNWKEAQMATIVVTRKHSNGNLTGGFYLVDMLALGVKDTQYHFNEKEADFFSRIDEDVFEEVSYPLAHNIIFGALAFADEHGFKPHKDFAITEYILEEDTDDIELIEMDFGIDGKPAFITADE
jgi:hypothetical protein